MQNKNTLPPFYVGQRVVAVRDHSQLAFRKGQEFTVTAIEYGCCKWIVRVGVITDFTRFHHQAVICEKCRKSYRDTNADWPFSVSHFAPIDEQFQSISYSKIMQNESSLINAN